MPNGDGEHDSQATSSTLLWLAKQPVALVTGAYRSVTGQTELQQEYERLQVPETGRPPSPPELHSNLPTHVEYPVDQLHEVTQPFVTLYKHTLGPVVDHVVAPVVTKVAEAGYDVAKASVELVAGNGNEEASKNTDNTSGTSGVTGFLKKFSPF